PGAPKAQAWLDSLPQTTAHLLPALARSGALTPALVWAVASVVLPWLARGRLPALDLVRVVVWAALLVTATGAVIAATHSGQSVATAPGAAVGAVAAAAIALAPTAAARWRRALRAGGARARLS
ncbi:MAG: hypothetical protein ACRDL5_01825, partial [Solirubrobacteraceae bacterium]